MHTTDVRTAMYLARQPILDAARQCVGYELLCRDGPEASGQRRTEGDAATMQTIDVAMHLGSLHEVTRGRRAYINFTRALLIDELPTLLPPKMTVLELLETIPPDREVVAACQRLKRQGYTLALDDYCRHEQAMRPLLELADIVKVDFMGTTVEQRREMASELPDHLTLLAEKVETPDEFAEAREAGYTLFQGFFFCKPELVERKQLPMDKTVYLRFLQQVAERVVDFDALEATIRQDAALSLRLLSYLNSAAIGVRQRVESIHRALTLLGETNLRRWASVFALTALATGKPPELIRTCLVRAHFCEQLVVNTRTRGVLPFDAFLVGMLSGIDAMLDCPIPELLRQFNVSPDVKAALLGGSAPLGVLRQLSIAYERGEWAELDAHCTELKIPGERIAEAYHAAIRRVDAMSFIK